MRLLQEHIPATFNKAGQEISTYPSYPIRLSKTFVTNGSAREYLQLFRVYLKSVWGQPYTKGISQIEPICPFQPFKEQDCSLNTIGTPICFNTIF